MVTYLVTAKTKGGGKFGVGVFKTKAMAQKQVKAARKSESFKKLGYSDLRIKKQKQSF